MLLDPPIKAYFLILCIFLLFRTSVPNVGKHTLYLEITEKPFSHDVIKLEIHHETMSYDELQLKMVCSRFFFLNKNTVKHNNVKTAKKGRGTYSVIPFLKVGTEGRIYATLPYSRVERLFLGGKLDKE